MKSALYLIGAVGALILTSCVQTTLENRRDLYCPQKVNGPYTRMLEHGIPSPTVTTTVKTTTITTTSDGKEVVK